MRRPRTDHAFLGEPGRFGFESCLRNEVGVIPECTGPGAMGVNDIHFHPVERRQFRVSLIATF
jgi:hypothetical protein